VVYLALGHHYDAPLDLGYEYPKDLRTYLTLAATLWLGGRVAAIWARSDESQASSAAAPATFDIREGARTIRAHVPDIVAAGSAGNYVEFRLSDGRRPLMRATLAAVEAELKPYGFLRAHRSWLINPLHVRGLVAEGSGDHRVELDGGLEVPLSRRFPETLQALRAPLRA
jgi:DNA-binding LytR/AlgR family response regulator